MKLSPESVQEFIKIYEKEFGKELSYAEAKKSASELLGLYRILIGTDKKNNKQEDGISRINNN
ncbi:MAG: hypothetical protein WCX95_00575 [Candidatus Gracilibacteria bacterium]